MWSSPLFWMVIAIASFWALGAYNRLMRLRSAVAQAFGTFDAHMVRLIALLGEFSAMHAVRRGQMVDGVDQELAALQGATTQLSACLAVVRARPLAGDSIAALTASRMVLQAAWQAAANKEQSSGNAGGLDAAGAAGAAPESATPSVWHVRWDENTLQNDQAARVFNDAVAHYNAAIAQFPANVLAWVFGFKAARGL